MKLKLQYLIHFERNQVIQVAIFSSLSPLQIYSDFTIKTLLQEIYIYRTIKTKYKRNEYTNIHTYTTYIWAELLSATKIRRKLHKFLE